MYRPSKKCRHGLSLIEVTVSSLLVGLVVVGSLDMLGTSTRTQAFTGDLSLGPILAEQLIAEMMAMPYDEPDGAGALGLDGAETDLTRKDFDDLDDYKNWSESTIQTKDGTPLTDTNVGTPLPDLTGWTREANVWWANRNDGNVVIVFMETGLKRFRVTVTSPDGVITARNGMRSRWGILEQPPAVTKIVVAQMDMTLTVGSSEEVHQSVNLLNHVEDPNAN